MNTTEFVKAQGLTMSSTKIPFRPEGNEGWDPEASHWACVIRRPGTRGQINTFFSMGSAHKGRPQVADVVDSLASDAQTAGEDFETWADEIGYDVDSRKAYATYEACVRTRRDLLTFFGHAEFRNLLNAERM